MFGNAGSYFDLFMKLSDGKYKASRQSLASQPSQRPRLTVIRNCLSAVRAYRCRYGGLTDGNISLTGTAKGISNAQMWNRQAPLPTSRGFRQRSHQSFEKNLRRIKKTLLHKRLLKQQSDPAITLTPLAAYLFRNSTTRLSNAEKNDITSLTELVFRHSNLDKRAGQKEFQVYPVDFDKNGWRILSGENKKPVGIEENMWNLCKKTDRGVIKRHRLTLGMGAKSLKNAAGFCDIIARAGT